MNMTFTFGWNYMELFVMLISIGLSTRFQQINQRIQKFSGKIVSEELWTKVHKDYVLLCELVEKVDHDLRFSSIGVVEVVEKSIARFDLDRQTNKQTRKQVKKNEVIIKSIPPEGWCIEMQRILDEARSQTIALSGMKFFYLTRKSILAMLATIVTYELVLLQLKSSNNK
ncbi:gustatory receptor for sugar taste 64a-like [Chironomus tepperi]|uniref:gustatory receptor for sugar taste 64a-like n=1 Tax=Chironomus tepperi TaxID=113505 RepID=UPI00391EEDBF